MIWEQWYSLQNDPGLYKAGIEVGARVIFQPKGPPKLRIVFRKRDKEESVDCVHIAVYATSPEALQADSEQIRSTENYPVDLIPDDYIFALNSVVAGIAEVGLRTIFANARETNDRSFGFNTLLVQQILKALSQLDPGATVDFCINIIADANRVKEKSHLLAYFRIRVNH